MAASGAVVMTATVGVAAPVRRRMILLPARGLRADTANVAAALITLNNVRNQGVVTLSNVFSGAALTAAGATVGLGPMPGVGSAAVRVLDSIAENGAKLIDDTTTPYSTTATLPNAGDYTFYAVVTDTTNQTQTTLQQVARAHVVAHHMR